MARADRAYPDLRVSDADRDAVASELGQHFQDGRLDQAEFDERVTAAISAKTEHDLDEVLTDLPRRLAREPRLRSAEPGQEGGPAAASGRSAPPGLRRPRALTLVPVLVAAVVISGLLSGAGWHHGWPFPLFGFLWLIVPVLACRTWIRGARRRQWR